jgi:PilZ domain
VSNVIVMDNRSTRGPSQKAGVRDRRYAIRYPFAADVELIDLETGTQATGVTSDISLGGCFVCTSKPFPLKSRAKVTLSRKGQTVKGLAVVRIVKPRIGMGIEFIDVESAGHDVLSKWIEQMRER